MSYSVQRVAGDIKHGPSANYFGGLDGLRLIAFLAVFGVHLPAPAALAIVSTHGWFGVELFFTISAFLLFRLMDAEQRKDGRINVRNFYFRRILRIYPLLLAYYGVTFVAREGFLHAMAWARFGTTVASVDNIAAWWWNYNYTIQAVGHLWTLAFEFQLYFLLPFAFLVWRRFDTRQFLFCLLLIELVAFTVRLVALAHGAPQVGIYLIPYFRPESILLGLALAVVRPRWPAWISLAAAIGAGTVFVLIHGDPQTYTYFPAAIMAAGLVDSAIRIHIIRAGLMWRPVRYLGKISFGLYVFHIAAIYTTVRLLQRLHLTALYNRTGIVCLSLGLSVVAAATSYRYLERPFLMFKRRFTSIEGRPDPASV